MSGLGQRFLISDFKSTGNF